MLRMWLRRVLLRRSRDVFPLQDSEQAGMGQSEHGTTRRAFFGILGSAFIGIALATKLGDTDLHAEEPEFYELGDGICGYKGSQLQDCAMIYAPWIPLYVTPVG